MSDVNTQQNVPFKISSRPDEPKWSPRDGKKYWRYACEVNKTTRWVLIPRQDLQEKHEYVAGRFVRLPWHNDPSKFNYIMYEISEPGAGPTSSTTSASPGAPPAVAQALVEVGRAIERLGQAMQAGEPAIGDAGTANHTEFPDNDLPADEDIPF